MYLHNEIFGNKKILVTTHMKLENTLSEKNQSQEATYRVSNSFYTKCPEYADL